MAARFLRRGGRRVLVRNYVCKAGEIDLVCSDGADLVFVEVKCRSSDAAQDLIEAVHPGQWKRVENAARCFRSHHVTGDRSYRFDLVTVLWPKRGAPRIEHFEHAHLPRRT